LLLGTRAKAARAALRRLAEQRATWLLIYDHVAAPDAIADLLIIIGRVINVTGMIGKWIAIPREC